KTGEISDEQSESDEDRGPNHHTRSTINVNSNSKRSNKALSGTIAIQIANFPPLRNSLSAHWHLYRIKMAMDDTFGFIVPYELIPLPPFNLYPDKGTLEVQLEYIGLIDFSQWGNLLGRFCRYIFEDVVDDMNIGLESNLEFDIENSTFKLLPCLLTKLGHIDDKRITSILNRKYELIHHPFQLNNEELYISSKSRTKQYYKYLSIADTPKKRKLNQFNNENFPKIDRNHDAYPQAQMELVKKPNINYLKFYALENKNVSANTPSYHSVEDLCYAPLNQKDLQLICRLPSIFTRIKQLYYIEQLRQFLTGGIRPYSLFPIDNMPTVTFNDCLFNILSSAQADTCILDSLNSDLPLTDNCKIQITSDLLFQATTRSSADENTNMKNLATLGDSFLKLIVSLSLYHQYFLDDTVNLTSEKEKQVSNKNLYRLGLKKNLESYLNINKPSYEGKNANWIPPGYKTINGNVSERYTTQKAEPKALADMLEALIGAFLVSTDYITTIKFMGWLGLDVIPQHEQNGVMEISSIFQRNSTNDLVRQFYDEKLFNEIEKEIRYDFTNKAYLITAFTHSTYGKKSVTKDYDRLKFVGNALLEHIIVPYILLTKKFTTPESKILFSYADEKNSSAKENVSVVPPNSPSLPPILPDVFEALVGAIFLDTNQSLKTVWDVIFPLFQPFIDHIIEHTNIHLKQSSNNQSVNIECKSDEKEDFGSDKLRKGTNKEVTKG
ncbi:unnamed protein product, partial [Adineta steineri]